MLLATLTLTGQEFSKELLQKAQQGDAKAQYDLYQCLLNGQDHEYSSDDIDPWLLRAAEGGYAPAQYTLGSCLFHDFAEGEKWIKKAAKQQYEGAQTLLGSFYLYWNRYDDAIKAFSKALKEDEEDMEAISGLADAYFDKEEYAEAKPWYELAATPDEVGDYDQGSTMQLGLCLYHLGQTDEAIEKFRLLTDGEESEMESVASYHLGLCYLDRCNYVEAMRWFTRSANAASYYQMGMMYLEGKGVEKDQDLAVDYFRLGIDSYGDCRSNSESDYMMADMSDYFLILHKLEELGVMTDEDCRYIVTELKIVDDDWNPNDDGDAISDD